MLSLEKLFGRQCALRLRDDCPKFAQHSPARWRHSIDLSGSLSTSATPYMTIAGSDLFQTTDFSLSSVLLSGILKPLRNTVDGRQKNSEHLIVRTSVGSPTTQ